MPAKRPAKKRAVRKSACMFAVVLSSALAGFTACASSGTRREPVNAPPPVTSSGSASRDAIDAGARGGARGAVIGHQMDQQAVELQRALPLGAVARIGEGIEIRFAVSHLFEGATAAIRAAGAKQLRDLAASVLEYPATELVISGHMAAGAGSNAAKALNTRRVRATFDYLRIQGVKAQRMRVAPEVDGTPTGNAGRVEIAIVSSEHRSTRSPR